MRMEELKQIENFLRSILIIDINSEIKNISIDIKRNHNLKLPDAIIAATSYYLNLPLMTADKRLTKLSELNIFHYEK